ncbi:MAG: hypothetical protein NTY65_15455 [Planctomycetota bacterium]|nr:hypothetical protein [Planctomycetota bacterium]
MPQELKVIQDFYDLADIKARLASWVGHARQADSERLLRRLSQEWMFTREGAGA